MPIHPVNLSGVYHRQAHSIAIRLPILFKINTQLQNAGAKFSNTHKCWLMPLTAQSWQKLQQIFGEGFTINRRELDAYLRKLTTKTVETDQPVPAAKTATLVPVPGKQTEKVPKTTIQNINAHVLPAMQQTLILKAYSPSTQRTYLGEMAQFLQTIKGNSADDFTIERLKDYFAYCFTGLKLSENTLHSRINALKFYFEQVLGREKFFWELPRPKKPMLLPRFFSQDEITAIIKQADNLKHKVMLMLCYSTGMRVSEVVALKTYNIISSRMCILIEQAKGKKDRITPLSPVLLVMLREYFTVYKPDKKGYLFAGQNAGDCYSTRSLQEVLQQAKAKANIIKPGGMHALRHSFATHLLDKGTDISMIQKLLGHNDLKTTLRYLHTTNKDLLKIISPLDDLKL